MRQGLAFEAAKIIKLAGAEYFVPVLAIRQNRICVPLIQELAPRIGEIGKGGTRLHQDDYDGMLRLTHEALTRAYPDVTLDELLDMEITIGELIDAINVIMAQTCSFEMPKPGAPVGELTGEPTDLTAPPPPSID